MTHIIIHHYVLHILGLTILRLRKHQGMGLEIILFKALKPYGPKLLKNIVLGHKGLRCGGQCPKD
jgi:hypothetical protein